MYFLNSFSTILLRLNRFYPAATHTLVLILLVLTKTHSIEFKRMLHRNDIAEQNVYQTHNTSAACAMERKTESP